MCVCLFWYSTTKNDKIIYFLKIKKIFCFCVIFALKKIYQNKHKTPNTNIHVLQFNLRCFDCLILHVGMFIGLKMEKTFTKSVCESAFLFGKCYFDISQFSSPLTFTIHCLQQTAALNLYIFENTQQRKNVAQSKKTIFIKKQKITRRHDKICESIFHFNLIYYQLSIHSPCLYFWCCTFTQLCIQNLVQKPSVVAKNCQCKLAAHALFKWSISTKTHLVNCIYQILVYTRLWFLFPVHMIFGWMNVICITWHISHADFFTIVLNVVSLN